MPNNFNQTAKGNKHRVSPIGSYGEVTTTGTSSNILWPNGAFVLPPSAGLEMTLTAGAGDTSAGTGIREIEIHYLTPTLVEASLHVVPTGATPLVISGINTRFVQCMHATLVGSGGFASGNITLTNGANTYSMIATGELRCSSSVRMVPKNKVYWVNGMYGSSISGSAAARTKISMVATSLDGHDLTAQGLFIPFASIGVQDGSESLALPTPIPFYEGVAIGMKYSTDKAATVTGGYLGFEEVLD